MSQNCNWWFTPFYCLQTFMIDIYDSIFHNVLDQKIILDNNTQQLKIKKYLR